MFVYNPPPRVFSTKYKHVSCLLWIYRVQFWYKSRIRVKTWQDKLTLLGTKKDNTSLVTHEHHAFLKRKKTCCSCCNPTFASLLDLHYDCLYLEWQISYMLKSYVLKSAARLDLTPDNEPNVRRIRTKDLIKVLHAHGPPVLQCVKQTNLDNTSKHLN